MIEIHIRHTVALSAETLAALLEVARLVAPQLRNPATPILEPAVVQTTVAPPQPAPAQPPAVSRARSASTAPTRTQPLRRGGIYTAARLARVPELRAQGLTWPAVVDALNGMPGDPIVSEHALHQALRSRGKPVATPEAAGPVLFANIYTAERIALCRSLRERGEPWATIYTEAGKLSGDAIASAGALRLIMLKLWGRDVAKMAPEAPNSEPAAPPPPRAPDELPPPAAAPQPRPSAPAASPPPKAPPLPAPDADGVIRAPRAEIAAWAAFHRLRFDGDMLPITKFCEREGLSRLVLRE